MLKQRFTLSEGERSSFDSLQVCLNKKFIHRYSHAYGSYFLKFSYSLEYTCCYKRSKFEMFRRDRCSGSVGQREYESGFIMLYNGRTSS